jgi:ABC-type branched-subunit amino acid transport system ATPase component
MPALLMIDEPTSGLNDQDASQILQLIEHVGRHMAVLLALHNQKQARTIGQSVILLAGGRVQEHSACDRTSPGKEAEALI